MTTLLNFALAGLLHFALAGSLGGDGDDDDDERNSPFHTPTGSADSVDIVLRGSIGVSVDGGTVVGAIDHCVDGAVGHVIPRNQHECSAVRMHLADAIGNPGAN